jgi:hypothetical protein
MAENAPFLPGLSPVSGKSVHLAFDGGRLTSCSQPTMSRLENLPTKATLIRMMARLAGLLAGSASRIGSTAC